MTDSNFKEAPPLPEMSPEEIKQALELLKNPEKYMNKEAALMVRLLYQLIVKHSGHITDMNGRITRIEISHTVYK